MQVQALEKELREKHPFRDQPIHHLTSLLNPTLPSPPAVVVYGFSSSEHPSSSKCTIVADVLYHLKLQHTTVKCAETITQRHLLHRILQACGRAISDAAEESANTEVARCENLTGLAVQLQKLLEGRGEKFVVVLDGIDRQRELGATLFPALARLGEMIPNLILILITGSPRPLPFQRPGIPYVHFPPYTRAEAITLVARSPPPPPADSSSPILSNPTTLQRYYNLFVTTVHDSLVFPTSGSSVSLLKRTCNKLWPKFIGPLLENETPPGKASEWDFSKLFVRNRALLQSEGENCLIPSFLPPQPSESTSTSTATPSISTPLLKYTPTLLLLAAYLASHTSSKLDILLFSRLSSQSSTSSKARRVKKSYHRKKLNFTTTGASTPSKSHNNDGNSNEDIDLEATPTKRKTPKKSTTTASGTGGASQGKVGKSIWSLRAAIPHPFPLDRLFSIYRAIHPHGISTQSSRHKRTRHPSVSDSLMAALVELARLRLVVPVSSGAGTGVEDLGGGEDGGGGGRWRVNVRRDFVEERCREWGIGDQERQGVGAVGEWEI